MIKNKYYGVFIAVLLLNLLGPGCEVEEFGLDDDDSSDHSNTTVLEDGTIVTTYEQGEQTVEIVTSPDGNVTTNIYSTQGVEDSSAGHLTMTVIGGTNDWSPWLYTPTPTTIYIYTNLQPVLSNGLLAVSLDALTSTNGQYTYNGIAYSNIDSLVTGLQESYTNATIVVEGYNVTNAIPAP